MLWGVSRGDQLLSEPLGIPLGLVPLKHNVTLSIHHLSKVDPINSVAPFVEEVLDSVLTNVAKSSLQESLLEVLVLSPIFKAVKSTLHSSLQESIEDLGNTSGAVGFGLVLPLGDRLASVMPVLERFGDIQVLDSLPDLN